MPEGTSLVSLLYLTERTVCIKLKYSIELVIVSTAYCAITGCLPFYSARLRIMHFTLIE